MRELAKETDFINLGTSYLNAYFHNTTGHLSPIQAEQGKRSVTSLVDTALLNGIPANKIIISISSFANGWQGVPANNQGLYQRAERASWGSWDHQNTGPTGVYNRAYLLRFLNDPSYEKHWDSNAKMPYLYNPDLLNGHFISYENHQSVKEKYKYLKSKGLKGLSIRRLHNDLKSSDSLVNSVYSNFHPMRAIWLDGIRFYKNNQKIFIAYFQFILLATCIFCIYFMYTKKQKRLNTFEQRQFQLIRDNLHLISDPLLRIYQMTPTLTNAADRFKSLELAQLPAASTALLKPFTQLASETNLNTHERSPLLTAFPSDIFIENIKMLLSNELSQRAQLRIYQNSKCNLRCDWLYLTQIIQDICYILLDSSAGKSDALIISTNRQAHSFFQISIQLNESDSGNSDNSDNFSKLSNETSTHQFYRLKEVYRRAQRINLSIQKLKSNTGFAISIPVDCTTKEDQSLHWFTPRYAIALDKDTLNKNRKTSLLKGDKDSKCTKKVNHSTQQQANKPNHLESLTNFKEAQFSARDAGYLIEQACEFFCIHLEHSLKMSIFQGEHLVSKIGKDATDKTVETTIRDGEFRFIIESEEELTDNDKKFFEVLVGQVQMVRKALKMLAKEPTILSELSEIASNREKIIYLKSDTGYTAIYTSGQKEPRYISMRLRNIKQYFDDDYLLQIHRSYLINPKYVKKAIQLRKTKYEILIEENNIPVSRTYLSNLKDSYPQWFEKT